MKTKMIGTLAIAGLIAMAVFVGPAAADGNAWIWTQKSMYGSPTDEFDTANNVYGRGFLGDESWLGCYGGRVYVVNHSDTWTNGTLLDDVSGKYETVHWVEGGHFRTLAWPKDITQGEYDLILDLNVTGDNGVWTKIPYPGREGQNITDPIWYFNITSDEPEPIPEFSTMAIPVVSILGLLFLFNYRKRRREG